MTTVMIQPGCRHRAIATEDRQRRHPGFDETDDGLTERRYFQSSAARISSFFTRSV